MALKQGKRALRAGDATHAEFWLQRAREYASYLNDDHNRRAMVLHRLGEVAVMRGEFMLARKRFKRGLELINEDNIIGRAILHRDYGEFERHQGNRKIARTHVLRAVSLLGSIQKPSRRTELESIVTHGFMARLKLDSKDKELRKEAIATLAETANKLHGCNKSNYELANLSVLVEELPLWDTRRISYLTRAVFLNLYQRNLSRAGEMTAFLGGTLPRKAYRLIVN
jgi:tetratricopeptide (TPR) repeat protein